MSHIACKNVTTIVINNNIFFTSCRSFKKPILNCFENMTVLAVAAAATVATAGAAAPAVGTVLSGATATSAGLGGATAAAGTAAGAAGTAASGGVAAGILSGPVGWLILGTSETQSPAVYTFDCWKQILHDESSEPSNGKILKEVAMDPRIIVVTTIDNSTDLPNFVFENIWHEKYFIEYVKLSHNVVAAHAIKI